MEFRLYSKLLAILTFLNLSLSSSLAYHNEQHSSGGSISIPSYSEPVSFVLYLALPGILGFLAIQQPLEKKLEGRWRRNEPARKYSSIVALLVILTALISVFHSLPELNTIAYSVVLGVLAIIAVGANKWEEVSERLPV